MTKSNQSQPEGRCRPPVRSPAELPIAKFSWLADHVRVTIALAIPMTTQQLQL
jgi:hypothetical protein